MGKARTVRPAEGKRLRAWFWALPPMERAHVAVLAQWGMVQSPGRRECDDSLRAVPGGWKALVAFWFKDNADDDAPAVFCQAFDAAITAGDFRAVAGLLFDAFLPAGRRTLATVPAEFRVPGAQWPQRERQAACMAANMVADLRAVTGGAEWGSD